MYALERQQIQNILTGQATGAQLAETVPWRKQPLRHVKVIPSKMHGCEAVRSELRRVAVSWWYRPLRQYLGRFKSSVVSAGEVGFLPDWDLKQQQPGALAQPFRSAQGASATSLRGPFETADVESSLPMPTKALWFCG